MEGNLSISAQEQITFLRQLYRNELPFRIEHQRLLKDVLIVEAGRDWILPAGAERWAGGVGWVEWPTGPVFFALNIGTSKRFEDLPKREAVVRAILRSGKALPSN